MDDSGSASVLLVTAGYDHTIRFWDVLSGSCLATLQHNESQVNTLAISEDKKFLAVAGNPNIRLFDIQESTMQTALLSSTEVDMSASTANVQAKNVLQGHRDNVTSVVFSPTSSWLLSTSTDGSLRIWQLSTLTCQREITNRAGINRAILHPNEIEVITADDAGLIKVWDLNKSESLIELCPEDGVPVISVDLSEDGNLLSAATESGNVYLWFSVSQESASAGFSPLGRLKHPHTTYCTRVLFAPNSRLLCTTGSDGAVRLWTIDSAQKSVNLLKTLQGHSDWSWDVMFSADSSFLVSVASDGSARLWDVEAGECICLYAGHQKALTAVAMNDTE